MDWPFRSSRSQAAPATAARLDWETGAFAWGRFRTTRPPPAACSSEIWAAPGLNEARMLSPARAVGTPLISDTRATRYPSPRSVRCVKA